VDGEVTPIGAGFIVTVRLRGTDPPDELASYRETAASATDLVPAIDRATRKLRGRIGESLKAVRATVPLERATTASLPALRKFTEGFRKNAVEQNYPAAIEVLEEAIALDTTFALAYRQAALAYTNAGLRLGRADTLRQRAFQLRDRLPELERWLVEATYYNYSTPHFDRARSIAANERALVIDPTSASALNGLGLLLTSKGEYARAESVFKRGQQVHPEVAFFWSNVLTAQAGLGKLGEAHRGVEEFRQRFPRNPAGPMLNVPVWFMEGRVDSASADCQRAAQGTDPQRKVNGLACLANIAGIRGRLRERDRLRAEARVVSAGRGVGVEDAAGSIDSAFTDIWFRDRGDAGVKRLDEIEESFVRRDRTAAPPFFIAEWYAFAGRPDKARAVLARYDSIVSRDTARARVDRPARQRAVGDIAVAEHKYDVAVREYQGADTLDDGGRSLCGTCITARLARAYDLAGKQDEAIAWFERYLASNYPFRSRDTDFQFLAGTYKRLAELYEAKGDREKAASYYSRFIDLWKDADPELQPKVADAKRRLASLSRESAGIR